MTLPSRVASTFGVVVLAVLAAFLSFGGGTAAAAPYGQPTLTIGDPCAPGGDAISGSGFRLNETVTLTFVGQPGPLATVRSDDSGNFSLLSRIPAGLTGRQTLQAVGSNGDRASASVDLSTCPTNTSPTPSPSNNSNGNLPYTGVAVAGMILFVVVLVGAGLFLILVSRPRRSRHS